MGLAENNTRGYGRLTVLILLASTLFLRGDVKSSNGTLKFDADGDGNVEATLTSTGLGIATTPSSNLHVAGNASTSGTVSIGGTSSGSANLHLNGSLGFGVTTFTSDGDGSDSSTILVDSSAGDVTITLPDTGMEGRFYTIKKITNDASRVAIKAANSTALFDDQLQIDLKIDSNSGSQLPYLKLVGTCSNYMLLGVVDSQDEFAHFPLNETSGNTVADLSVWNNSGAYSSNTTTTTDFSGNTTAANVYTTGTTFSGNEQISITNDDDLNVGTSDFATSIWLKTSSNDRQGIFFKGKGGTGGKRYLLHTESGGRLRIEIDDNTAKSTYLTSATINDHTWHHILINWDRDANATVYIDGTHDSNGSISGSNASIDDTSVPLYLGYENAESVDQHLSGSLSDFRLYKRLLTQAEITALHQQGQ